MSTYKKQNECDSFTMENLRMIKEKTGTGDMNVSQYIQIHPKMGN